jgi:hypothetical protein
MAFIAVATFIRAFDKEGSSVSDIAGQMSAVSGEVSE